MSELLQMLPAAARSRIAVWDEEILAWPFFFDAESPLGSGQPRHHWHRHDPDSRGETCHPNRHVWGAVAEMAAQIYLGALLEEPTEQELEQIRVAHWFNQTDRFITVCAECPATACCPWVAPVVHPTHTISNLSSVKLVQLGLLGMSSCAQERY